MDLSLDDVNNNASFLNVRYLVENDSSTCNRGFEFDFFLMWLLLYKLVTIWMEFSDVLDLAKET